MEVAAPAATRTIARLWRDGVAQGRDWPAYLVEHGDHWHAISWEVAGRRVEDSLWRWFRRQGVDTQEGRAKEARRRRPQVALSAAAYGADSSAPT